MGLVGRIPVRNLWFLMLYASELIRTREVRDVLTDEAIDDLPDLIARLLAECVDRRLRRNLTRGYRRRAMDVTRVRGRIDFLITEARQLLSRGEIFCRFEELTIDTPRNRLVRGALERMSRLVNNRDTAHRCRALALSLARAGVRGALPMRAELAQEQLGRNDSPDRYMVALAELALELAIPTEDAGPTPLVSPEREETWVRRLFEKAVLGFAKVEMERSGWRVRGGVKLNWQISDQSANLSNILPGMETDIVLDPPKVDGLNPGRRIVIDTKFASVLAKGRFGGSGLKSGYLYQMYTYLRSQEGLDPNWDAAAGLFLHPSVGATLRESASIQGHLITFATVDLGLRPAEIRNELRSILMG